MQPDAWQIDSGQAGKPRLAGASRTSDLRFNLSHCRSLVAVAVSTGREVGIDVEPVARPVPSAMDLATRYFTARESAGLAAIADPGARQRRFLSLWTAKEALIKATGRGLALGLDTFDVDPERGHVGPLPHDVAPGPWQLVQREMDAHWVSVCWEGRVADPAPDFQWVAWDDSVRSLRHQ